MQENLKMPLTQEQKDKIEENRRKALEKKKQKEQNNGHHQSVSTSIPKNPQVTSTVENNLSKIDYAKIEENRKKALERRQQKSNDSMSNNGEAQSSSTAHSGQNLKQIIEEKRQKALEIRQRKESSSNVNQLANSSLQHPPSSSTSDLQGQQNSDKAKMKRMEENKQRALEIRQKKEHESSLSVSQLSVTSLPQRPSSTSDLHSSGGTSSSNNVSSVKSAPELDKLKWQRMEENKKKALEIRQRKEREAFQNLSAQTPFNKTQNLGMDSQKFYDKQPNRQKVIGKCILISRDRFSIDIKYDSEVIAIFKQSKTGSYNAKDRTWNFSMMEHDDLLTKLRPLQSQLNIHMEALPRWIIDTFKNFKQRLPKEEDVEFGNVEPQVGDLLMPFQRDAVIYALQRQGRVFLADDMGLGKTIQALAIASAYRQDWPLLIVCPSSVRFTWRAAVFRWLPTVDEENVNVITNGRDDIFGDVIIISYDLLSRKQEELIDFRPRTVILDESHLVKSSKSARTKAAEAIVQHCRRVLLLSGTPALSKPLELFTQIRLIEPKLLSYNDFGMRYCDGKKINFGAGKTGHDFKGSSNMEELRLLLYERLMVRRMKSDVLKQLPSKQRQVIVLDPSLVSSNTRVMKNHAKAMQNMRKTDVPFGERKSEILLWFNDTATAKMAAVKDYVKDLIESDKKFLCFAHHNVMIRQLVELCESAKVRYIKIDGTTDSKVRKHLCDEFQTDDQVKVAVLSINACNAGITLTAAQLVVFAELAWTPGALSQAEDRAHRIGKVLTLFQF